MANKYKVGQVYKVILHDCFVHRLYIVTKVYNDLVYYKIIKRWKRDWDDETSNHSFHISSYYCDNSKLVKIKNNKLLKVLYGNR